MISRMMHLLLFTGLAWSQTKTVAVFDFQNDSLSSNEVSTLMDRLRTDIAQVSDFIVVERHRMIYSKNRKFKQTAALGSVQLKLGNYSVLQMWCAAALAG